MALDSFSLARPQEKAYLQTDRNTYHAGETVFFKTYTTLFEKPGILSKIIYVMLTDKNGKVLDKKMIKLQKGSGSGQFEILTGMPTGSYYISAYTLWMLNFPDFIFTKKIGIINSPVPSSVHHQTTPNKINIAFFPEGGQLITGVKSKVAFKATDEINQPVTIEGIVTDDKNSAVANFKTSHDGMGSFDLVPSANTAYKISAKNTNGKQITAILPVPAEEGIVMTTDNSNPNKIFLKIARGEKNKSAFNELILVAQQNYQLVYMAKMNIDEGLDAAAINKKNLLPGILQITVMNASGIPLAERLVFISNQSSLNDKMITAIDTNKRAKNTITIDVGDFSEPDAMVSVYNDELDKNESRQNILSALLLTNDIKGYVHNPAYYFSNKEAATLQHLDLVMLTNGWRRYLWKEILENKYSTLHYPFETGLSITGQVLQSNGKSLLKGGKINLVIKGEDSTSIMSEATVNDKSVFIVDNLDFKKSATVYYQGTNPDKTNAIVAVKIDPSYSDTVTTFSPGLFARDQLFEPSDLLKNLLAERKKNDSAVSTLLNEVVLKSKRLSPIDSMNQLYVSPVFQTSDQTLVPDNALYFDVWQYLQRMVPGITINKDLGSTQVNFSRYGGLDFFNQESDPNSVQFFLNEVPVSTEIVDGLNPNDIGIIKIYKGVAGIALGVGKGAIAIYTVKGKNTRDWRSKGFDFFKKSGYAINKEYYRLNYAEIKGLTNEFSDVRATLYWNPNVKVIDGKMIIEFYNDDMAKKFRVLLEGIDKNGRLLHIEKTIN